MPYQANIKQLQRTNSTTYVDELGLLLGLDRLQGETSVAYLRRLEAAARLNRQHPYEGTLNDMSLQLGFEPSVYMQITVPENTVVNVSIAGVKVGTNPIVPLLTFEKDAMWKWRMLSEVASDLNSIATTQLFAKDGPAFQLARQSNSQWVFSESVAGVQGKLQHSGVQVGSEMFNQLVSKYTLDASGSIVFDVEPPTGTQITYNYIISSYDIVGSPIAMIGLKDPNLISVANAPDTSLAYQIREFIQSIMLTDRSYWTK